MALSSTWVVVLHLACHRKLVFPLLMWTRARTIGPPSQPNPTLESSIGWLTPPSERHSQWYDKYISRRRIFGLEEPPTTSRSYTTVQDSAQQQFWAQNHPYYLSCFIYPKHPCDRNESEGTKISLPGVAEWTNSEETRFCATCVFMLKNIQLCNCWYSRRLVERSFLIPASPSASDMNTFVSSSSIS